MTPDDRFGTKLSAWLQEEAGHRVPSHLAEVLVQTAGTRQRPWWSSPERWLPMDFAARTSPLAPPRLGRVLVVGLLVLALAGLAVLASGSLLRRVPEPFGPARNGLLAYWLNGDIHVAQPDGTGSRALVPGATNDIAPWFSHDGTRLVFLRQVSTDESQLMVADADGGGVRPLLEAPLVAADWFEWSPRDDRLAVLHSVDGTRVITVLPTTGDPRPVTFDLGDVDVESPLYWLPPDGSELVFTAEGGPAGPGTAIYAIRSDGTGLRTVATAVANGYRDLAVAPSGQVIAYSSLDSDSAAGGIRWHVHALDVGTGIDRAVAVDPQAAAELGPVFSPDGSSLLLRRELGDGSGTAQLVLAGLDGLPGGAVGPVFKIGSALAYGFSPDGRTVFLVLYDGGTQMIDLDTGAVEMLDPGILNLSSWQRLKP